MTKIKLPLLSRYREHVDEQFEASPREQLLNQIAVSWRRIDELSSRLRIQKEVSSDRRTK